MEVECIGNTQIIHMEETGITQRTIGLLLVQIQSLQRESNNSNIPQTFGNSLVMRGKVQVNRYESFML